MSEFLIIETFARILYVGITLGMVFAMLWYAIER